MFILIEGNILINLALMSRIELIDHKREAKLWNAGVLEGESCIIYEYLKDPANAAFVMVPVASTELPKKEAA